MKLFLFFILFLFLAQNVSAMGVGVAPSELSFRLEEDQVQSRELTVYNLKERDSKVHIEAGSGLLKFAYNDSISAGGSGKVVVSVDSHSAGPGNYSGRIYVSLGDDSSDVEVRVGTAVVFNAEILRKESSEMLFLAVALLSCSAVMILSGSFVFFRV